MPDVLIIGGGAAGMMAAVFSARSHLETAVIEQNERCGRKLSITGKGRCNLTNNTDTAGVMKNVFSNPKFLYAALNAFTPSDTMEFFEKLGVPLKTERGKRVFPVSDNAYDVVDALAKEMKRLRIEVIQDKALDIEIENGAVKAVKCEKGIYRAHKIILAAGGMSYPLTGSDGSGYKIAANAGHTITTLRPALVPLETEENCAQMMGLALKNVKLSLYKNGIKKPVYSEQGEMLFTHFGVSGPLVLTASCYITDEARNYNLSIDLKPALDEKMLDSRLQRELKEQNTKNLSNVMRRLMPENLVKPFLTAASLSGEKKGAEISRAERQLAVQYLKKYPLHVTKTRPFSEAVVTCGGVSTAEIDPKTMESKIVKGLYFAGEIIDICAFTGGYNLQTAFSTAYSAANIR